MGKTGKGVIGIPLENESIPAVKFDLKREAFGENKVQLTFPQSLPQPLSDVFIKLNYIGDTGMSFMNGEPVDDQFYYGHPWVIGLKKFYDLPNHEKMICYFRPVFRNATYIVDLNKESMPDFLNSQTYLKVGNIDIIPEYHGIIRLYKNENGKDHIINLADAITCLWQGQRRTCY